MKSKHKGTLPTPHQYRVRGRLRFRQRDRTGASQRPRFSPRRRRWRLNHPAEPAVASLPVYLTRLGQHLHERSRIEKSGSHLRIVTSTSPNCLPWRGQLFCRAPCAGCPWASPVLGDRERRAVDFAFLQQAVHGAVQAPEGENWGTGLGSGRRGEQERRSRGRNRRSST